MTLLNLLAALALCGSVFMAVTALFERPASPLALPSRGAPPSGSKPKETAVERARLRERREGGLADRLPFGLGERVARALAQAGNPASPSQFVLFCLASGLCLPALIMAMFVPGDSGTAGSIMALGALVLGPAAPYVWLSGRIARRRAAILKSLPDTFDLLTTCVEAGLGLDAALNRVAMRTRGPFGDELTRTIRELGVGRARREALRDLGRRTQIDDLELFVSAVIQAEQMGSSIGPVLRVQSAQMRQRQRQRAEQQAHRAPVKMMFPLVAMIFPSLFVVILGPAAIELMSVFRG